MIASQHYVLQHILYMMTDDIHFAGKRRPRAILDVHLDSTAAYIKRT